MSLSFRPVKPGRVVVGFSASMQNEAALATALFVAEKVGAEICGLFLEERDLLEHAGMNFRPQTASFDIGSTMIPVTQEAMRAALKREISRWRNRLSVEAERRKLKWSFDVKPAGSGDWLLREIDSRDLLILIRDSVSESLAPRSQYLIEFADQIPSLIVGTGSFATAADAPVVAILEEGVSEESMIEAALELLGERSGTLHLIVMTDRPDLSTSRSDEFHSVMDHRRHAVVTHTIASGSVAGVVHLINALKPSLTVADRHLSLFQDTSIAASLIRSAASPFLLLSHLEHLAPKKEISK